MIVSKLTKSSLFTFLSLCFYALLLVGCSKQASEFATLEQFIDQQNIDQTRPDWKQNLAKPPQMVFDPAKKYYWDLQTTQGNLSIEFMPDVAPMHVSSTVYLTLLGFYDDLIFHRVITGFMAQGGDPLGAGIGGPGYNYSGEFSDTAKHDKAGILSMANRGPATDGSQFFITFKPTPHLNGRHTVFGQLVSGMDNLKAIEKLGSSSGQTKEEIKIVKATVRVE